MSQMDREEYEERTRPKLTGGSSPTAKNTLRVILLGMAVPIILSATGPLYYGYTDGPYWRVIVWALACTVGFSWLERSSFTSALSTAPPSMIGRNPISFVVPCHRVVGSNGTLTGYHWGVPRKRAILGWEAGRLPRLM